MGSIHFHHAVPEGDHIFHITSRQVSLCFKESVQFPLRHFLGVDFLIARPGRDYRYFAEDWKYCGQESLTAELDPAFTRISNDVYTANSHSELKHFFGGLFKDLDMLHDVGAKVHIPVNATRANETCAEQCVVPVKDDGSLVLLWLLHGCEPDLFVRQPR